MAASLAVSLAFLAAVAVEAQPLRLYRPVAPLRLPRPAVAGSSLTRTYGEREYPLCRLSRRRLRAGSLRLSVARSPESASPEPSSRGIPKLAGVVYRLTL